MRLSRKLKNQRGAALVEFAITLPLLLLVVWGTIDFARLYFASNSLATAVREGARYAAVLDVPGSVASKDSITKKVKRSFNAFGGDTLPDTVVFVLDSARLPAGNPAGNVTVGVKDYKWSSTTPIKIFPGGQILMTRRAKFRWEREPD